MILKLVSNSNIVVILILNSNEENFCIIDDYEEMFMRCQFDPITNNYDESIIRKYLNSDRFIERLGVNREDIKPHYKGRFANTSFKRRI